MGSERSIPFRMNIKRYGCILVAHPRIAQQSIGAGNISNAQEADLQSQHARQRPAGQFHIPLGAAVGRRVRKESELIHGLGGIAAVNLRIRHNNSPSNIGNRYGKQSLLSQRDIQIRLLRARPMIGNPYEYKHPVYTANTARVSDQR